MGCGGTPERQLAMNDAKSKPLRRSITRVPHAESRFVTTSPPAALPSTSPLDRAVRSRWRCFPHDVRWEWMAITPAELATVRYIDYDYWVELSGGTRLAAGAAPRRHRPRTGASV